MTQEAKVPDNVSQIDGQEIEFGPFQWGRSRTDIHQAITSLATMCGLTVVATDQSTQMGLSFDDLGSDDEGNVDLEFEDTTLQYLDRIKEASMRLAYVASVMKHQVQNRDHGTEEAAAEGEIQMMPVEEVGVAQ